MAYLCYFGDTMKVLLVNPNRYRHPPVIPIGLEYLVGALRAGTHEAEVADLCFTDEPAETLSMALEEYRPDVVGFTVRQIDTCLYRGYEFFLDDVRDLVSLCRGAGLPVVLGGAGFSIMPAQVLSYTGADYGVAGPGERAFTELLDAVENNRRIGPVLDGYRSFFGGEHRFSRVPLDDYDRYFAEQGITGFRTKIGCRGSCFFCTESAKPLVLHEPEAVGEEVAALAVRGCRRFHLCDSELNQDVTHSIAVCDAIRRRTGGVDWALYMKPEPVSGGLFDALAGSGATTITVSIDTLNYPPAAHDRLRRFFDLADERGIKIMVDLSVGYPYETRESTERMFESLEGRPSGSVGVNSYFRLYPGTPLHRLVEDDPGLAPCLLGGTSGGDLVHPVFFRWFTESDIEELTADREAFRIEGRDKATNYQRADKAAGSGYR